MIRKTLALFTSLVILLTVITISCNVTGDDCGPFNSKFKTVDFDTDLKIISISENRGLNVQYRTLESDTIEFDKFGISMFPVTEFYSLNTKLHHSFSLIPSAFACSPLIPVSEEVITDIEIFSDRDFNSSYSSGDNLADVFEVIVFTFNTGYHRYDLINFLSYEPIVPDKIFLLLKVTPETTEPIQFTVKYSQNGIDMNSFEFTTEPIFITN